jgi:hypothetical protein
VWGCRLLLHTPTPLPSLFSILPVPHSTPSAVTEVWAGQRDIELMKRYIHSGLVQKVPKADDIVLVAAHISKYPVYMLITCNDLSERFYGVGGKATPGGVGANSAADAHATAPQPGVTGGSEPSTEPPPPSMVLIVLLIPRIF